MGTLTVVGETELTLADSVEVEWKLETDRKASMAWEPILADSSWQVLENPSLAIQKGAKNFRLVKRISLAPSALGDVPLQFAPFKIRWDEEAWQSVPIPPLFFKVKSKIADPEKETPRDITGIETSETLPPSPRPLGGWIALGILVVGVVVAWWIVRRPRRAQRNAQTRALREIDALLARKWGAAENSRALAYLLHRVVRRYLDAKWSLNTQHCTSSELLALVLADERFSESDRAFLRGFLEQVDLIKFAPTSRTTEEIRGFGESVKSWIRRTAD